MVSIIYLTVKKIIKFHWTLQLYTTHWLWPFTILRMNVFLNRSLIENGYTDESALFEHLFLFSNHFEHYLLNRCITSSSFYVFILIFFSPFRSRNVWVDGCSAYFTNARKIFANHWASARDAGKWHVRLDCCAHFSPMKCLLLCSNQIRRFELFPSGNKLHSWRWRQSLETWKMKIIINTDRQRVQHSLRALWAYIITSVLKGKQFRCIISDWNSLRSFLSHIHISTLSVAALMAYVMRTPSTSTSTLLLYILLHSPPVIYFVPCHHHRHHLQPIFFFSIF